MLFVTVWWMFWHRGRLRGGVPPSGQGSVPPSLGPRGEGQRVRIPGTSEHNQSSVGTLGARSAPSLSLEERGSVRGCCMYGCITGHSAPALLLPMRTAWGRRQLSSRERLLLSVSIQSLGRAGVTPDHQHLLCPTQRHHPWRGASAALALLQTQCRSAFFLGIIPPSGGMAFPSA